MQVEKGDFVLLMDPSLKKPVLAKCLAVKGDKYSGILSYEKRAIYGDSQYKLEFDMADVVANLGAKPMYGKAYKSDVEPYFQTLHHKLFKKPIAVMVDLDMGEKNHITRSFNKLARVAKEYGFLKYIRNITVLVRPGLSKTAGIWSLHKEEGEKITLFVPRTETAVSAVLPWDYVLFHEIGHHFWNMYMTEEEKASWISLYRRALDVEEMNMSFVTRMRAELEEAGSIKALRKQLEGDQKVQFGEILKASMKAFSVRPDEIDAILASGENLSKYWITTSIQRSDSNILITEYARKNSQELFAECVAHLLADMEMPKKLQKRTANTVRRLAKRGPHGELRSVTVTG